MKKEKEKGKKPSAPDDKSMRESQQSALDYAKEFQKRFQSQEVGGKDLSQVSSINDDTETHKQSQTGVKGTQPNKSTESSESQESQVKNDQQKPTGNTIVNEGSITVERTPATHKHKQ